jgi:hypothetical protein
MPSNSRPKAASNCGSGGNMLCASESTNRWLSDRRSVLLSSDGSCWPNTSPKMLSASPAPPVVVPRLRTLALSSPSPACFTPSKPRCLEARRRVVARLAAKGLAITQRQMRRRFGDELRPRRGAVDRAGRRGPRTDGRWSWGQRRRRAFARWLRHVGRRRRARGAADHVQCGVRKVALLDVARRLQRRPAARAHRHRGSIVRMRRILGLRTPRLGHLDSESSAASRHCYRT